MTSRKLLLHNLCVELSRLSEQFRQRDPKSAEAAEALTGIHRQLAATSSVVSDSAASSVAGSVVGVSIAGTSPRTSKRRRRLSRKQLLAEALGELETIKQMLLSSEVTSQHAATAFSEFRSAVVETAAQRRKHLVDLAYLHSLVLNMENYATKNLGKFPLDNSQMGTLKSEIADMFNRCGGTILANCDAPNMEYFEISGNGPTVNVLRPAYVATNADGRNMLVAKGAVERNNIARQ